MGAAAVCVGTPPSRSFCEAGPGVGESVFETGEDPGEHAENRNAAAIHPRGISKWKDRRLVSASSIGWLCLAPNNLNARRLPSFIK